MATTAQRKHVVHLLDELYRYRSHLDYPPGDIRTSRDLYWWHLTEQQAMHVLAGGGRLQADCSEFVPWVLKCAGLWHWSQPGATSSHVRLLPVYTDAREAYAGSIVVFGPGGGHHEAIVHTPDRKGGNPLLFSHGRPGVDKVRLHDMQASQTAEGHPGVRLLSIAHL